jgi:thiopeptide-type bacteriocin biosynthesis protein
LVEADNLLPLDLGNDRHQQLLRTHLGRHGHARLDEAPRPGAFGWLNSHAHEITVSLTSTMPPHPDRLPTHVRPVNRDDGHLPGRAHVLYAKLYTSKDRIVGLAHQVPELMAETADFREWWYLPYSDPEPHLRLRIRLPAQDAYGRAAVRLSQWVGQLRANRLISRFQLDTYTPETGRYGHGDAMIAAEAVFAADSAAALGELRAAVGGRIPLDALTAASFVDTVTAFTGDPATAMTWIVAQLPNDAAPPARPTYLTAVRLADPEADWAALRAADTTGAVRDAWRRRGSALATYRDRLSVQRDPISVLPSLLHLHSLRVHGIDPDRENVAGRLTRAAALRWSALHPASSP